MKDDNEEESETVKKQKRLLDKIRKKLEDAADLINCMKPEEAKTYIDTVDVLMHLEYRVDVHDGRVAKEKMPFEVN